MGAASKWLALGLRRDPLAAGLLLILAVGLWGATGALRSQMRMDTPMDSMPGMNQMMPGMNAAWTPAHAAFMLLMWVTMMAAMMLPVAAPIMLSRTQAAQRQAAAWVFLSGYLAIWTAAAVIATGLQWRLEGVALLSADTGMLNGVLAPALLVVVGVYQWTWPKSACLDRCCGAHFDGTNAASAFRDGLRHGVVCLGCCWALMLLMFAGAMQSLLWMATLTLFIILERALPNPRAVSRSAGAAAIIAGLWWLSGAVR
jgi:predicted metal-binding membrane protein